MRRCLTLGLLPRHSLIFGAELHVLTRLIHAKACLIHAKARTLHPKGCLWIKLRQRVKGLLVSGHNARTLLFHHGGEGVLLIKLPLLLPRLIPGLHCSQDVRLRAAQDDVRIHLHDLSQCILVVDRGGESVLASKCAWVELQVFVLELRLFLLCQWVLRQLHIPGGKGV